MLGRVASGLLSMKMVSGGRIGSELACGVVGRRAYDAKLAAAGAAAAAEAEAEERIYSAKRKDSRVRLTFMGEGVTRTVFASTFQTLHDVAIKNEIAELPCICNGKLSCSTCHVYIDPKVRDLPHPSSKELDLIDKAGEPRESSRLGCQVRVTRSMDGTTIGLPAIVIDNMRVGEVAYASVDLASAAAAAAAAAAAEGKGAGPGAGVASMQHLREQRSGS